MAFVILGETKCSICDANIAQGDDLVETSHFIEDRNDPLWAFSDAALHKECFLEWGQREEFIAKFNAFVGSFIFPDGSSEVMQADGRIQRRQRTSPSAEQTKPVPREH